MTDGSRRAEPEVVIREDGAASIDRIDLGAPTPTPSAAGSRTARPSTATATPTSTSAAPDPSTRPSTAPSKGYDTSQANPGPYRIGHAVMSSDAVVARRGLTLDLEPSGPEAYSARGPAVTRWQGRWWMAYVGMGDDRRYRIMTASFETCGD